MQIFLSFLDCLGLIRLNLSMRQQDFNHELFRDDEVLRQILFESKELMAWEQASMVHKLMRSSKDCIEAIIELLNPTKVFLKLNQAQVEEQSSGQ